MATVAEHKCITCEHFDCGDNECTERVIYLNSLNQYEIVSDCEYWKDKKGDKV